MTRFMRFAGERAGRTFADYGELWRWSVDDLEAFWAAIWDFAGVRASRPYERVLDSPAMPGARWFAGAELNYAENVLTHGHDPDQVAIVYACDRSQTGGRELGELTWAQLAAQVAELAGGLRALGVGRGDRVVAYMPNIPETVVALLAVASLGAIWSSAAPEFGARSVIDRFAQVEPVVLLAVDGYRHGGRDFDRGEQLRAIAAGLPSVRHTVLLPNLDPGARAEGLPGGIAWSELTALGAGAEPAFEQVPFDHPLWVLYSSGTTGLPKAIVHGHGGILVEQLKTLMHLDLRGGDRVFWFTTTGWMMWNFLVGCLLGEAAIVLYDGSPGYPDMGALWRLAQEAQVTCMGVSAGYLAACERDGVEPGRDFELGALRAIGSTGSPLAPESFRWVSDHVGEGVWLFSTSGGTDVCTAFVGGCPLLPVYAGELQARSLGCAVEAFDERGRSVLDEVGELVLTKPLPSMPLYFWGDPPAQNPPAGEAGRARRDTIDPAPAGRRPVGERYRESYFAMYPGVWRHGDWIRITPRGGAVIYGRSDSTINRQGVRMGTSEIYRAAGAIPEVQDTLVVDVPRADGRRGDAAGGPSGANGQVGAVGLEGPAGPAGAAAAGASGEELWMILFVVLTPGAVLDDELRAAIGRRIREDCSPRHVPNEIVQVQAVPRTLSGKVLEVPVKRILMGVPPREAVSAGSLADPGALDFFVELARARTHADDEL
jgi:acetoacetyl-CoA synthetase